MYYLIIKNTFLITNDQLDIIAFKKFTNLDIFLKTELYKIASVYEISIYEIKQNIQYFTSLLEFAKLILLQDEKYNSI